MRDKNKNTYKETFIHLNVNSAPQILIVQTFAYFHNS